MFIEKRWFSIILVIIFAVTIFYLSSQSHPPAPKGIDLSSVYHFLIFFYFAFFLFLSIKGKSEVKPKYLLITLIMAILYAASDEFHQFFVPYRACTIQDFLTDSAGIISSLFLISLLSFKNNQN